MVTISPVSPATATVEPSGEATEAFARRSRSPSDRTSPVLTSITRQCIGGAVPGDLVDHRGAPVPDRGDVVGGKSRSHRPREAGTRRPRRWVWRSHVAHEQAAVPVDVRDRGDVAVEELLLLEDAARGGVEDARRRVPRHRTRRSTCRRRTSDPGDARCRWPKGLLTRARARGRRFAGDGVDEPDPSRVPVEPADRPPAARPGRSRRARTPRRCRPGSSAADTCPPPTGPRCAASSRRRPRRPGHRPG